MADHSITTLCYTHRYFLGLPRSLEGVQKICQDVGWTRRLVLRQIERLVRTLNEVKDQLVPKSSKKLPKKNEQAHKQDGEERGVM